jgi:Flp pilus assembly pilin Flp
LAPRQGTFLNDKGTSIESADVQPFIGTFTSTTHMSLLSRLWIDDRGQDLVEYVLLGATVALAGLATMQAFPAMANALYTGWDNAQQDLWEPRPPAN